MNAGMYGMPDGVGLNSRLIARVSNQPAGSVLLPASAFAPSLGFASSASVASSSASTKYNLIKINGKGALRFFSLTNSTGGPANMDIEIVIDGAQVLYKSGSALGANASFIGCGSVNTGSSYSPGASLDFMPFKSALELNFIGSIGNYNPVIVYDIYQ